MGMVAMEVPEVIPAATVGMGENLDRGEVLGVTVALVGQEAALAVPVERAVPAEMDTMPLEMAEPVEMGRVATMVVTEEEGARVQAPMGQGATAETVAMAVIIPVVETLVTEAMEAPAVTVHRLEMLAPAERGAMEVTLPMRVEMVAKEEKAATEVVPGPGLGVMVAQAEMEEMETTAATVVPVAMAGMVTPPAQGLPEARREKATNPVACSGATLMTEKRVPMVAMVQVTRPRVSIG